MGPAESLPQTFEVPDGAKPGQFCRYHMVTQENPDGTDCTAHLNEARVFKCGYASPEQATNGVVQEDGTRGSICQDFSPRDFGPDSDFRLKTG